MSGQDTPGRLVSGLRRLTHVEEWLNQDAGQHASELALKRKGLSSRRQHCFQAELRSLDAQAECLDAFLEYLPQRYPELYQVKGTGAGRTVSVLSTGETHAVADFAHAPLELCNRIVQEDLVLMRTADEPTAEHRHVMSAASVVFSFGDLDKKLGSPLAFIHAPVPGFEKDLAKLLNKTFDGLQVRATQLTMCHLLGPVHALTPHPHCAAGTCPGVAQQLGAGGQRGAGCVHLASRDMSRADLIPAFSPQTTPATAPPRPWPASPRSCHRRPGG